jgi:hypothetical protein
MKGGEYMNKKIAMVAIVFTIVGAGLVGSAKVFAQTTNGTDHMSTLVQKIASTFGLKNSDVQAVFDQHRSDRQATMETAFVARLDQAVKDGSITDAQKQLILAKHKELVAKRQADMQVMAGKTVEERKAAKDANKTTREAERNALQEWATQNGIDVKFLMSGFAMGDARGHGRLGNW